MIQDISPYIFYEFHCSVYNATELLEAIRENTKFKLSKKTLFNDENKNNCIMKLLNDNDSRDELQSFQLWTAVNEIFGGIRARFLTKKSNI